MSTNITENSNMPFDEIFSEINEKALKEVCPIEIKNVMGQECADISYDFLGFVNEYYGVSQLVSKNFNILDLGCAYGIGSVILKGYKSYVGVDSYLPKHVFNQDKVRYIKATIEEIVDNPSKYGIDTSNTFAVMSYAKLSKDYMEKLRKTFPNHWLYFPKAFRYINIEEVYNEELQLPKKEIDFSRHICRITNLPCCGCSMFCEHREIV